jgi:NAD(P)-dependent dehydrogenase (short-subunit alcohol dehydrogenase family)
MQEKPRAFVAGGSGALGRSVCRCLLREGYEVHALATSADHGLDETPGLEGIAVHIGDFSDEQDAERLFREAGGPLAALVSTVGGYAGGHVAAIEAAEIERMTRLNLTTTALILKCAYPYLERSPQGAGVVLVASRAAVEGGPGAALYGATKAAVINLALSAAKEWRDDGISVNAILPSTMDTPANRAAMPKADFSSGPRPRMWRR